MKRRGGGVSFWENLTSQTEIALFAESFAVFASKQFIQCQTLQGRGWPGQVRPSGPHFGGAFGCVGLNQGSHTIVGGGVQPGLGRLLPDLHTGLAPNACRSQSSIASVRGPG